MLPAVFQPLLADIGEVLGSLIGIAAFVLWIIRQIVEANKQAPQKGRAPVAPARPQPAAKGGPQPMAGQQADPLRAQVEEFLRRAGRPQQADQPGAPRRPQPASDIEVLLEEISPQQQRRSIAQPLRPVEKVTLTPVQPSASKTNKPRPARRLVAPTGQGVAEHVAQRVEAHVRTLAEKTSQLGQRIITEDRQFDDQVKAKFDHAVGTLGDSATPSAEQATAKTNTPAAQIASLLANPDGVRQAVLVNEILRRPVDRWS
jgi:hypothetical protein